MGGAGAVAQQPFEAGAILGFDAHGGVQGEPAAVAPAGEDGGDFRREGAMAEGDPQHPATNPTLRRADHGRIETGGGVEVQDAGRVEAEHASGDAAVPVGVGIEYRAKALHEAHRPAACTARCIGAAAAQSGLDCPQYAAPAAPKQHRLEMQEEPQPLRERHDPLAHRHLWDHLLDQVRGARGHAPGGAGRAYPAALAGEGDHKIVAAVAAAGAGEAAGQDPALEIAAQLALDVARDWSTIWIGVPATRQPGLEVLLHQPVERAALGSAAAIDPRRTGTGRGAEMP